MDRKTGEHGRSGLVVFWTADLDQSEVEIHDVVLSNSLTSGQNGPFATGTNYNHQTDPGGLFCTKHTHIYIYI